MKRLILLAAASAAFTHGWADGPGRIESKYSAKDAPLSADPNTAFWKAAQGVFAENDQLGKPTPGHRTEIRSRWTDKDLYILFLCPYEKLNLKSDPVTDKDTFKLWEWDVAEVFIGADFDNIHHYREYQVSPQNEWIDLDIERKPVQKTIPEWNSGFTVKARIDESKKVWYGEMKIPISSINGAAAKAGQEMRANFYRFQGPGPKRAAISWQPTGSHNHIPEAFGRLVLVK
ncbi:MAG: carbohydrate-binding family 9-like protein [Bryobacteraceae bacterium]|nr:carbohydrate-binding family 9-like protein [Bryobacteraceae bacterium]